MARLGPIVGVLLMAAIPANAGQMVGYTVDSSTGLVETFSCDEHGDPSCFVNRTELGVLDARLSSVYIPATAIAPGGELVVANQETGNQRLVWFELPSLAVVSSIPKDPELQYVGDIAFAPDGTLWVAAAPQHREVVSLYTVDQATGEATEVWTNDWTIASFSFVGNRLFVLAGSWLLEVEPGTGAVRMVKRFGRTQMTLSAYDNRLWSLSAPGGLPTPNVPTDLGFHNLETGDRQVLVNSFYIFLGAYSLDLVDSPEQQPAAVPVAGRVGVVVLVTLIGISAWIVLRRRVWS